MKKLLLLLVLSGCRHADPLDPASYPEKQRRDPEWSGPIYRSQMWPYDGSEGGFSQDRSPPDAGK